MKNDILTLIAHLDSVLDNAFDSYNMRFPDTDKMLSAMKVKYGVK